MKTFLRGKVLLYYINAINDAFLAGELVKYLQGKSYKQDARIREYIEVTNNNRDLLLGVAYTLYFWNGLYDFMFARFLGRFLLKNIHREILLDSQRACNKFNIDPYKEFGARVVLISPIFLFILGVIPYKNSFKNLFNVKDFPSKRRLLRSIIIVQELNVKNNYDYVEKLANLDNKISEDNLKLEVLQEFLENVSDELYTSTKQGIEHSLIAASTWDRIFMNIIRVRYFFRIG